MALTNQIKLRIVELRAEGLSYANIAKELNVAKQTAVDVVGESQDQVATLQAIQMEALFEAKRVNTKGRIEQLSALQEKLLQEIERRDLTDLPTEKLISLYLNTTKNIKDEVTLPSIRTTRQQESDRYNREELNW